MAVPSLMATHWVGQDSGHIFCCLWTKVHQIKFASAGLSVVCNAVFRLTMSGCVPEIFAIKSQSCLKSCRNFDAFGPPNFGVRSHPNFWPIFINLGHHWTCVKVWWRSAKRPRRLSGKKEDLNYSGKTGKAGLAAAAAGGGVQSVYVTVCFMWSCQPM